MDVLFIGELVDDKFVGYEDKYDFLYIIWISWKMILKILIKDNLFKYFVDVLKLVNKICERNLYGVIGYLDWCVNELIFLKGLFGVFIYILYILKICGYYFFF